MKDVKSKNYIIQYVICTYGLFDILLLTLGGIATEFLNGTPPIMRWLTVITAWTPTYVLLLMFKKPYPNSTVRTFFKRVFNEKPDLCLLATTTILQMFVFVASVYIVSV